MKSLLLIIGVASLWTHSLAQEYTYSQFWNRATTIDLPTPPDCSLDCVGTFIPQICSSLANTTCICTSPALAVALGPCVLSSCNVTDALRFIKYSKDSCGVVNDKSRVRDQLNTYYVTLPITTIFMIARVFARMKLEIGLGPDDWFMIAAYVMYVVDIAMAFGVALNGFGQHMYYLTPHQISQSLRFFYFAEIFYHLAITLTKLSLLLFFLRIFTAKAQKMAIWGLFGFVVVSNTAMVLVAIFQCTPIHGAWTNWAYKSPQAVCVDRFSEIYASAGLSTFQDVLILLFPIPIILRLNLSTRKKGNLLVMFLVGIFVIIASLLRLPWLKTMKDGSDPSYDQAPVAVWSVLETSVGIICGCLPACRTLIGYLIPSLKTQAASGATGPSRYQNFPSSKNKRSRQTVDDLDDFVELNDRTSSNDELTVKHASRIEIAEKLVFTEKGCGVRTTIDQDPRLQSQVRRDEQRGHISKGSNGIMMTKTVEQFR
ncbi:hypothetical protein BGZ60DRAFT_530069 [Tricladium varicosporioides]|nr:hypothetical protein BGZ60DRAFT_530069 [Hymenoscyphus varicosporioides]